MGVGRGLNFLVIFSAEFFLSIFSAVREISRTFEMLTPRRWTPRGGVGKFCFIDFLDIHGAHWHWLIEGSENVAGFIVTSFATQRLAEDRQTEFVYIYIYIYIDIDEASSCCEHK